MITLTPTAIPAVKLITNRRFADDRGFFCETWNSRDFKEAGITLDFVQDNEALSHKKGTIRGLHYQLPPFAQDKLVRVLRGSVYDVAVDLRRGSPTFGQHIAVTLTDREPTQLLVPAGFAHGYCTLEPDTVVAYKVTAFYSKESERGILWNDPALKIAWPVTEAVVSDKDQILPRLSEAKDFF